MTYPNPFTHLGNILKLSHARTVINYVIQTKILYKMI
jgi:hypothetical protein